MRIIESAQAWAEAMFSKCAFGDSRRTRRLVDIAARLAENPAGSPRAICKGHHPAVEAVYRLLRNKNVDPKAMEDAPFQYNAALCAEVPVVLALQDTVTLAYPHIAEQLGGAGLLVHSTLALDWTTQNVIGLIDQQRWAAPAKGRRKRESDKWELASQRIDERLDSMTHVILVCDREIDIYETIEKRRRQGHRFIIRATDPYRHATNHGRLWELMKSRRVIGTHDAGQEFHQSARSARTVELRTASVRLVSPANPQASIPINVVDAREKDAHDQDNALAWMFLTTEPIGTLLQAKTVIQYYECRQLMDEFHKTWKSDCAIETRRLQTAANMERLAVITAHVAAWLLQRQCRDSRGPRSHDTSLFW